MRILLKPQKSARNQSGVTLVFVAIMIVVFLGVAALAIDIGYQRVVRNELQNAADATALAACNKLYSRDPVVFSDPNSLVPKWNEAVQEANDSIGLNEAANQALQDLTSLVGWWDITKAYSPDQWTISSPSTDYPPPTSDYGPAIRVTVAKTSAQNSGPISNFFGGILGIFTSDVSATATAVAASPGSVRPESVIPYALNKKILDLHYEDHLIEENPIVVGSTYHYPEDLAGQWTSFFLDSNSTPSTRSLIEPGNPSALSIGDLIWMQKGTMDNLYDSTTQDSIEMYYADRDVAIPIVDPGEESLSLKAATGGHLPIVGFIGFHIICAGKGCQGKEVTYTDENGQTQTVEIKNNEPVLMGYFTTPPVYGGGSVGPHYGPLDRCRLCR